MWNTDQSKFIKGKAQFWTSETWVPNRAGKILLSQQLHFYQAQVCTM